MKLSANFKFRVTPLFTALAIAGACFVSLPAVAKTVNVDGTNFTTLSAAVADAYSDADPAVVNLLVDSLPTADGQVILDKPIVINGDADGNTTQCDLLANMSRITSDTVAGVNEFSAYITVFAPGLVDINNVRIRPNADGTFNQAGAAREFDRISGIRLQNPTASGSVGTYNLTRVYVSGSNSNGDYVSLADGSDLFNQLNIRRWGGHNGKQTDNTTNVTAPDTTYDDEAAIQIEDLAGAGTFNSTLDHCHAGLSRSAAINLMANAGTHTILGGVYGHCARDGIRVGGSGVTIKGTSTDRVRVVRSTNINGDSSHGIEVADAGQLLLLQYVDIAAVNSANLLNFRNGSVGLVEFVRCMGKFPGAMTNQAVYIDTAGITIGTIQNCTFHGMGAQPSPFNVTSTVTDPFDVKNTIFTSQTSGTVNFGTAPVTFSNYAFPNDSYPGESLPLVQYTGTGATFATPPVTESPRYQKVLADYDWSNYQNGDGNDDVLRPSNSVAYATAREGGSPLTGGASGTEVPVSLSGFEVE